VFNQLLHLVVLHLGVFEHLIHGVNGPVWKGDPLKLMAPDGSGLMQEQVGQQLHQLLSMADPACHIQVSLTTVTKKLEIFL
jgi:hypothetical protein